MIKSENIDSLDVTSLKTELERAREVEKELREQVEELRDFIENAALPLHWVNWSGIIIWANQIELDVLGYTKEEYIGKHISKFHMDQDIIEDILVRLINKETIVNYPARLKCKNGDVRHVLINSNVLWKDGQFIHTRCFTRDITELKKAEAQKVDQIITLEEANKKLRQDLVQLRKRAN